MKPNAPSVLERSIYWQRHVAANTRGPRQKARALKAIERLTEQLERATALTDRANEKEKGK